MKLIEQIYEIEQTCFTTPWSKNAIAELLKSENSVVKYEFDNNQNIIAYIIGQAFPSIGEAELYRIAVSPNQRKCGLGKILIKSFIDECISKNCNYIFLEVRESNSIAVELYKKMGFDISGIRKNYYNNPEENAILMEYKI